MENRYYIDVSPMNSVNSVKLNNQPYKIIL